MLAKAFENAKQRGHILRTVQADWRWLNRDVHGKYDAVICLGNSFTHLHDERDRRKTLAEFYAALKHDGVLILDQRNYDTMLDGDSDTVQKAREYYNSEDADNFYFAVWGGEDIHIGVYQSEHEPIMDASRRTVAQMADQLSELPSGARILDIGAGYGGSARYLAREHGFRVTALNLSEVENERDREMNREQGLDHLIEVLDGDFENLPFKDDAFDAVWSQDAILHSGDRERVFEEVDRVLKPGGHFVFTDILQQPDIDPADLQPVYERIHLDSLGSEQAYDQYADELGWQKSGFNAMPDQLPRHYQRVHDVLTERRDELSGTISDAYMDRMQRGLQHWVEAGRAGRLSWGVLHYAKPGGSLLG